ncbi:MAG: hypothetical protein PHE51_08770 [Eubacteriales bacterium]|nr:hypothetical protein [Eubacteriales bacterium]
MNIKQKITRNLINIPGWHTNKKIVVIESDDWGSVRMPSREVYQQFLDKGVRVDKDPYCRYDCLATAEDLEALFEVLTSVKDKNGRHAVLTADTVVANPLFDKIKESGFKEYFYEPFTETLKRDKQHEGAFELWKQGMAAGIFHPQLHGREHLNVKKWLRTLQSGEEVTRLSFDLGTFGLTSLVDARIKNNYMGAFNSGLNEDIVEYDTIITEGQQLFEQIFGYKSESFIATTYTWNPKIEPILLSNGVKYIQGIPSQHIPLDDDTTFIYKKDNYLGKKSNAGLLYLVRNCHFEPSQGISSAADCLKRVSIAFRWCKPAIISMHRLNVIGGIVESNRKCNLKALKWLLAQIVQKYPDVEFITSDQLGNLINTCK